jgi:hypothetical protein
LRPLVSKSRLLFGETSCDIIDWERKSLHSHYMLVFHYFLIILFLFNFIKVLVLIIKVVLRPQWLRVFLVQKWCYGHIVIDVYLMELFLVMLLLWLD